MAVEPSEFVGFVVDGELAPEDRHLEVDHPLVASFAVDVAGDAGGAADGARQPCLLGDFP